MKQVCANSIDIRVATHKPSKFSLPDYYLWIQVNAEKNGRWDGYLHDNDGIDNISGKNGSYCELTAMYSLWKHSSADIKGLCHYRRFFGNGVPLFHQMRHGLFLRKERIPSEVIKKNRIVRLLKKNDILVSAPIYPYPNTAYEDLMRFVYLKDINTMIDVVEEFYQEYTSALWVALFSTNIHYCNMFIASRDVTDAYCKWLFSLLAKIEDRIDISFYDGQHKRLFGYLAEVLLNVYIRHHGLKVKSLEQLQLDEQTDPVSLKKRLVFIRHNVYSFLKLVPPQNFLKELWRARIMHYTFDTVVTMKMNSPKEKIDYFKRLGGTDIRFEKGASGDYMIVHFNESTLRVFFADDLKTFLRIAESLAPCPSAFGFASINRIYCSFAIDQDFVRKYAREGLFVFSYN